MVGTPTISAYGPALRRAPDSPMPCYGQVIMDYLAGRPMETIVISVRPDVWDAIVGSRQRQ